MDKKLMEQRAKFVEKAKKISMLEPDADERPRKSGSKVHIGMGCGGGFKGSGGGLEGCGDGPFESRLGILFLVERIT